MFNDLSNIASGKILLHHFSWGLVNPPLMTSPEESTSDSLVIDLQAGLNRFVPYTKLIYFNMPHLEFEFMVAPELSKRLWQGLKLDVLNLAISVSSKIQNQSIRIF